MVLRELFTGDLFVTLELEEIGFFKVNFTFSNGNNYFLFMNVVNRIKIRIFCYLTFFVKCSFREILILTSKLTCCIFALNFTLSVPPILPDVHLEKVADWILYIM